MKNFRDRIRQATEGYSQKVLDENTPKEVTKRDKPNESPEENLTIQPLMKYMKARGWKPKRYESKYIWSQKHQRYVNSGVKKSTPDIGFSDAFGFSCWCEAKAPGRRSTWTEGQEEFIRDAINRNQFACVSDSVENFVETYEKWIDYRMNGSVRSAQDWLTKCLPKEKRPSEEDGKLF